VAHRQSIIELFEAIVDGVFKKYGVRTMASTRTDDQIIQDVIETEGGFVNRENDHGGPTNFGITLSTLSAFLGHTASEEDVRNLSKDTAAQIYKQRYITAPRFDLIHDDNLRALVVDCGVLHGPSRAAQWLQTALNVKADGIIGTETIHTLMASDSRKIYLSIAAQRIRFMGEIVTTDYLRAKRDGYIQKPLQAEFAHGWLNRVAAFVEKG
jgi:lysozyme family protein